MCVIAIADTTRPTPNMVERMYDHNSSGAGIAWREEDPQSGEIIVKWEKGLELEGIKEYCATAPLPYIAHFRIPTCGGTRPALCHPFPIHQEVGLELSGSINGGVLFHNGHWNRWKDFVLDAACKNGFKIPGGKWSDSRAMAWAAAHYGMGILEFIDEKAAVIGPDFLELYGTTPPWGQSGKVWVSNKQWEFAIGNRGHSFNLGAGEYGNGVCMFGTCRDSRTNGTKFCLEHQPKCLEDNKDKGADGGSSQHTPFRGVQTGGETTQTEQTEQQAVQEGSEKVRKELTEGNTEQTDIELLKWAKSINPKKPKFVDKNVLVH